jgi:glutamate racemase
MEDRVTNRPIAVFDSGLGGLSVVRHLRRLLPAEDIVYFGDTARVPYGTKSRRTVVHFGLENARFLMRFEPKLIAVACNTVSALAIDEIREALPAPVVGVVEPGARTAAALARGRTVAILGTEATVGSGAYEAVLRRYAPDLRVLPTACPLFVPMVEEGRTSDDPLVRAAVDGYLHPLREAGVGVAVLACTHYPLLRGAIGEYLGEGVDIIDSGRETSQAIREALAREDSLSEPGRAGSIHCYVSDNPRRFREIGSRFLEESIDRVELVEPERYVASAMGALPSL